MNRVSIHVATADRPTELSVLLHSLRHQTFKDWDLILCDEGKENINKFKFVTDVLNRIKLEKHAIIYHNNNVRKGISNIRNLCVKYDSLNDIFIRVDDDSVCAPDYLERLVRVHKKRGGCVGGVVPPFNTPEWYRDCSKVKVFNRISFTKDGVQIADDGGYIWTPNRTIPSHHLRSSFLFTRKIFDDIGGFKLSSPIGWREETIFSMEAIWKGYKLWTDTGAVCWHAHGRSGPSRLPPNEYKNLRERLENWFQTWAKRKYMKHGWEDEV